LVFGVAAVALTIYTQKSLGRRETQSTIDKYSKEEIAIIERAHKLLRTGYYDLAVVEAFKAIEISAKKYLLGKGFEISPSRWFLSSAITEVLPPALMAGLHKLRQARNTAAHGASPISESLAKEMIPLATSIVARLGAQEGDAAE
jgi:HEPN domain-containing protein